MTVRPLRAHGFLKRADADDAFSPGASGNTAWEGTALQGSGRSCLAAAELWGCPRLHTVLTPGQRAPTLLSVGKFTGPRQPSCSFEDRLYWL